MANIMQWLSTIVRRAQHQTHVRTEKLQEIEKLKTDITATSDDIKKQVREYQEKEDPLGELMRTLRPKRSHSRRRQ